MLKNCQPQHKLIHHTTLQTTAQTSHFAFPLQSAAMRSRVAYAGGGSPLGRALTGEAALHLRQRTEEGAFRLRRLIRLFFSVTNGGYEW